MDITNKSRCLIATRLLNCSVTTILYQTGYGYSAESGIRYKDGIGFELIQHGWPLKREAHAFVCLAVSKGWDGYQIGRVMDFIKDKNYFRKKPMMG